MEQLLCVLETRPFIHPVSVLLAPHGEGLIHPHYRHGLSRLSRCAQVARVSCQTNLSMDAKQLLDDFSIHHADFSRVSLWATFHPSMADLNGFLEKIHLLSRHFPLSVGAVADPENLSVLRQLKDGLPGNTHFWLNAMDGRKRPYTDLEEQECSALDPFWNLERGRFSAQFSHCSGGRQSIFVQADGTIHPCNRSPIRLGNLYETDLKQMKTPGPGTCRGRCDCFLAYSFRKDLPQLFSLGPWPQMRLGRSSESEKIQALFLDVDGTLTGPDGYIRPTVVSGSARISGHYAIYLVTALPVEWALKKCRAIWPHLAGGVFAYGADIRDFRLNRTAQHPLPVVMKDAAHSYGAENSCIYKQVLRETPRTVPPGCRIIVEEGVVSLCAAHVDKVAGVQTICAWNGWNPEKVAVMGNSAADVAMLTAFPFSLAPPDAEREAADAARFHMTAEDLFLLCSESG